MTDNEIIKVFNEATIFDGMNIYLWQDNDEKLIAIPLKKIPEIFNRQKAEIERLQGCVKSEDEVRAIMESQMTPMIEKITEDLFKRTVKLGRTDAIVDFTEWLLSLFPEDKNFTTISRFTVKQKYKEMVGEG